MLKFKVNILCGFIISLLHYDYAVSYSVYKELALVYEKLILKKILFTFVVVYALFLLKLFQFFSEITHE